MCKLEIIVSLVWRRSSRGDLCPTAIVNAVAYDDIHPGRRDVTHARAGVFGADKEAEAVNAAMAGNPLMQSLLLWDGFSTDSLKPGQVTRKRFGRVLDVRAMGMTRLAELMRVNGFDCADNHGPWWDHYTFTRDMPAAFTRAVMA